MRAGSHAMGRPNRRERQRPYTPAGLYQKLAAIG